MVRRIRSLRASGPFWISCLRTSATAEHRFAPGYRQCSPRVYGVDGRSHHIKLADLNAAGDSAPGSIVELRAYDDSRGNLRVALAVRSDPDIERQVTASGATWLDRQNIAREPAALSEGGFGAEVRGALDRRAEHLIGEGFAERQGRRIVFSRNLIDTLCRRELEEVGEKLAAQTGQPFQRAASGEHVAGAYRQRLSLASGRFAMIDDGLGFQLVPWTPSMEKHLGRHVSGVARGDGGVDWSFGRKRGLGRSEPVSVLCQKVNKRLL